MALSALANADKSRLCFDQLFSFQVVVILFFASNIQHANFFIKVAFELSLIELNDWIEMRKSRLFSVYFHLNYADENDVTKTCNLINVFLQSNERSMTLSHVCIDTKEKNNKKIINMILRERKKGLTMV